MRTSKKKLPPRWIEHRTSTSSVSRSPNWLCVRVSVCCKRRIDAETCSRYSSLQNWLQMMLVWEKQEQKCRKLLDMRTFNFPSSFTVLNIRVLLPIVIHTNPQSASNWRTTRVRELTNSHMTFVLSSTTSYYSHNQPRHHVRWRIQVSAPVLPS